MQAAHDRDKTPPYGYAAGVYHNAKSILIDTIRLHWRGEAPLMRVILINLFGIALLLNAFQEQLNGMADGIVFAIASVRCGPVLVWQAVGLLRTCSRHLSDGGDVILSWSGYATLLIVIAMTASLSVGSVLSTSHFKAKETPLPGGGLLPVSQDGRDALFTGAIDYQGRDALTRTLDAHPGIRRIILESDGGLVFAARTMVQTILTTGLDTHVDAHCSSACTLVFAAGAKRTMAEGATLGFHAYGKSSKFHLLSVDAEAEQAKDASYLRARGVSEAFLEKIYTQSIDALWQPDRPELVASGVLTQP